MSCPKRTLVDRHFAGALALRAERELRAHLDGCAACHAYYRRRQILASLDPEARAMEERLARPLGLRRRTRPGWVLPALALAAALLLFLRPTNRELGFHARGPGLATSSRIAVYRVDAGDLATRIARDDELAFTYQNVEHKPYLMVYGVDEGGRVYWFYPEWTDAAADPAAVPIAMDDDVHTLTDAIRHPLVGSRLVVHGLFLDRPLTVSEVERTLRAGQGAPGTDHETALEIVP